ncbi:3'-5' exonuclease [Cryptosporangium aurantiacum]|uniref:DNA 3'-5' helicase n=1 Tax=Cryptosporangium aurantiacum TaxID=134849 RepID=A0A1M7RPT6_9ACTN|nr:3'-5' exonuclease [Cryptosporangium aurantiacum]SHN48171.1 Part of AAA domain-containing protein [Cryptosporangium aurantiacum]
MGETTDEPSAVRRAALLGLEIAGVERQLHHLTDLLKQLRRNQRAWLVGAQGERDVIRVLVDMDDTGWHVLPDRRWPGTRRANIDVLVVGPGGVFVIDVKNWREARLERGRLWRGEADADDEVRKLLDQSDAVEQVLVDTGLPPTEVIPLLVLAGRRNTTAQLDRITILGEQDLTRYLVHRGARLSPALVERLLECLDRDCPPMEAGATTPSPRRHSPPTPARDSAPAPQSALFSQKEVWDALFDAVAQEPIESWMTWLHPAQARLIGRPTSGPARIRGAAGTGKTVVALHRARYLAARGERVLFTSLVRTLAPINRALLTRMAPDHVRRVQFTTVHALAMRCLRDQGLHAPYEQRAADTCFALAWARVGRPSSLGQFGVPTDYWHEEVSTVIKGRGLTEFEQYAELARVGRRIALQPTHRAAVWDLYERYERLRKERGVLDGNDVLLTARDVVRERSLREFDAVIVDEVQDLTCVGLQLLHAFVGDKPDGLLIVGDGQQSIYPGGFTLSEAGVSVVGRSTVLSRNYRNREEILRYAQELIVEDTFEDLDKTPEHAHRDVSVERPGGDIRAVYVPGSAAQESALCEHLIRLRDEQGVRLGDSAVLVPTNAEAGRWHRVLEARGLPAMSLEAYDGTTSDAVKVGTYHRAKGLDFAHVCIPDRDLFPRARRPAEPAEVYAERAALERRQLYVALTRARDSLWIGLRGTAPQDE